MILKKSVLPFCLLVLLTPTLANESNAEISLTGSELISQENVLEEKQEKAIIPWQKLSPYYYTMIEKSHETLSGIFDSTFKLYQTNQDPYYYQLYHDVYFDLEDDFKFRSALEGDAYLKDSRLYFDSRYSLSALNGNEDEGVLLPIIINGDHHAYMDLEKRHYHSDLTLADVDQTLDLNVKFDGQEISVDLGDLGYDYLSHERDYWLSDDFSSIIKTESLFEVKAFASSIDIPDFIPVDIMIESLVSDKIYDHKADQFYFNHQLKDLYLSTKESEGNLQRELLVDNLAVTLNANRDKADQFQVDLKMSADGVEVMLDEQMISLGALKYRETLKNGGNNRIDTYLNFLDNVIAGEIKGGLIYKDRLIVNLMQIFKEFNEQTELQYQLTLTNDKGDVLDADLRFKVNSDEVIRMMNSNSVIKPTMVDLVRELNFSATLSQNYIVDLYCLVTAFQSESGTCNLSDQAVINDDIDYVYQLISRTSPNGMTLLKRDGDTMTIEVQYHDNEWFIGGKKYSSAQLIELFEL